MTREEVHRLLGPPQRQFRRGSEKYLTDFYTDVGVFVYYGDDDELVEAIEFCDPASVMLQGRDLMAMPYTEVEAWLKRHDSSVVFDGDGITCEALGVGVYAPSALESPQDLPEGVIVFPKGYYEE